MYSAKRLVTVALLGQPPGYFLLALPARSQVILMLEAWGESENSGDSNTRAMSGEWIFQRQAQSPRSAGGGKAWGEGWFPRVPGTSAGTLTCRKPRQDQH